MGTLVELRKLAVNEIEIHDWTSSKTFIIKEVQELQSHSGYLLLVSYGTGLPKAICLSYAMACILVDLYVKGERTNG